MIETETVVGYLARERSDNDSPWCHTIKTGRLVLANWKGETLGPARIVARWATPRSYISECAYQVEVTLNGVVYTGRSAGIGMRWRGRPKKGTD